MQTSQKWCEIHCYCAKWLGTECSVVKHLKAPKLGAGGLGRLGDVLWWVSTPQLSPQDTLNSLLSVSEPK